MMDFAYIDLAFATSLTKDPGDPRTEMLAKILKASREGALSIDLGKDTESLSEFCRGSESPLVLDGSFVYLRRSWRLKEDLNKELERLLNLPPLETFLPTLHPDLYATQKKAIKAISTNRIAIVTGGPGTGKSFVAKNVVTNFREHFPNSKIVAAAPTGKALTRLKMPNLETKTLHSLLQIKQEKDLLERPKKLDYDLLIVDECSMIGLPLWAHFFKSLSPKTRLLLIGDPDQLPPVDGGAIFPELSKDLRFASIHLDECRRSDNQGILALSRAVQTGSYEDVINLLEDKSHPDITLLPLKYPDPFDPNVCYLTPFQKGPYGTTYLNAKIDGALKEASKPLLITQNDYTLNIMNGEIGRLFEKTATFPPNEDGKERVFPLPLLKSYELAYALSVHKSQGSEFPHVALFLPEGSERFGKSLLYTAVTRAKESLTIFSTKETLGKVLLQ